MSSFRISQHAMDRLQERFKIEINHHVLQTWSREVSEWWPTHDRAVCGISRGIVFVRVDNTVLTVYEADVHSLEPPAYIRVKKADGRWDSIPLRDLPTNPLPEEMITLIEGLRKLLAPGSSRHAVIARGFGASVGLVDLVAEGPVESDPGPGYWDEHPNREHRRGGCFHWGLAHLRLRHHAITPGPEPTDSWWSIHRLG